jgi:tRNA threonylcarbamoyl adenosine modification protein YjeE
MNGIYSELDLKHLAETCADHARTGDIFMLEGPLGSGKSTFARFFIGKCIPKIPFKGSPTFSIAHDYTSVVHIDLYRIKTELELFEKGIYHVLENKNTILLIEWGSLWPQIRTYFDVPPMEIHFDMHTEATRRIEQKHG